MEGNVGDGTLVAVESSVFWAWLLLRGGSIPNADGLVQARRGEPVAVGAEGHAEGIVDVAAQREDFLPGRRVPELDRLIQARGRQSATIGAEGHTPERADVAAQAKDLLPGLRVPDLDFPVGMHRQLAANCGDSASVGTEGHRLQVAVGVMADELFPAGLCVPHFHQIVAARDEPPTVRAELNAAYRPVKVQRERLLPRVHVPNL